MFIALALVLYEAKLACSIKGLRLTGRNRSRVTMFKWGPVVAVHTTIFPPVLCGTRPVPVERRNCHQIHNLNTFTKTQVPHNLVNIEKRHTFGKCLHFHWALFSHFYLKIILDIITPRSHCTCTSMDDGGHV